MKLTSKIKDNLVIIGKTNNILVTFPKVSDPGNLPLRWVEYYLGILQF